MQKFRIVEIPPMKVVTSGPITSPEAQGAFCAWWTGYDSRVSGKLTPRDFMMYNAGTQRTEWMYTLPVPEIGGDYGGYEVKEYPFGLYAVGSCLDADVDQAADWLATRAEIMDWVRQTGCFAVSEDDGAEGRHTMFHIVTPSIVMEKLHIHVQDMYVPIRLK